MSTPLRQLSLPASAADAHRIRRAETAPSRPAAAVRWLDLPGDDGGLLHRLQHGAMALTALVRPHRLRRNAVGHYAARRVDRHRGCCETGDPLRCVQGAIGLLQARVLADLGIQAHRAGLLRHRARWPAERPVGAASAALDVDCRLARVVRVGPTEVVALLETHVADAAGRARAQLEDAWLVSGLEVADAVQADEDDLLRRAVSRMRRRERLIDATASVQVRHLFIAPPAWHWLRPRHPHVPPTVLRHHVARELAACGAGESGLQIAFVGRARPGQTLRLLLQGDAFELIDERGRLLAFGTA